MIFVQIDHLTVIRRTQSNLSYTLTITNPNKKNLNHKEGVRRQRIKRREKITMLKTKNMDLKDLEFIKYVAKRLSTIDGI